jgi:hypothetical protein
MQACCSYLPLTLSPEERPCFNTHGKAEDGKVPEYGVGFGIYFETTV